MKTERPRQGGDPHVLLFLQIHDAPACLQHLSFVERTIRSIFLCPLRIGLRRRPKNVVGSTRIPLPHGQFRYCSADPALARRRSGGAVRSPSGRTELLPYLTQDMSRNRTENLKTHQRLPFASSTTDN